MCEKDGGDLAGESLFQGEFEDFLRELNNAHENKFTRVDRYLKGTYWIGISTSNNETVSNV